MTLPQAKKMASLSTGSAVESRSPDVAGMQCRPVERSLATCDVGAMSHELNGLVTALLFHIGYLQRNSDRFVDADAGDEPLKEAVDGAYHVAELICSLTHRIDGFFVAPSLREAADVGEEPCRAAGKPLTRREREVLRLVSEGYSNKEGAKLMNISHRTFECHRAEVMRKLGAKNTAELVRLVILDTIGLAPPLEQTGA